MPKVKCFKFRNNILSKLIRKNNWRTPKGFYKHFYLGQNFKDKKQLREEQSQREKESEIKKSSSFMASFGEDVRLAAVEAQICEKGALIESIYNHSQENRLLLFVKKLSCIKKN